MKTYHEEVAAPCETGWCTPPMLSENNDRKNYTGTSGRSEDREERKKRIKDGEDRSSLL
jgi:hypothetical protein